MNDQQRNPPHTLPLGVPKYGYTSLRPFSCYDPLRTFSSLSNELFHPQMTWAWISGALRCKVL